MLKRIEKPLSQYDLTPEKEEQLLARIDLVEVLLDPSLDDVEKDNARKRYTGENRCSLRTIRNYLKRYKEQGYSGLILHQHRGDNKPMCSPEFEQEFVNLIKENPRRTIPGVRLLLANNEKFSEEAKRMSERQLYRIAHKNHLTARDRINLAGNVKRAYHSFEASCSMELVQGDARDGIWITGPDGKRRKTYLFIWIDDYSRKILYARYYFDEKLPRMEDSFKNMILRYGIPEKIYLDNGSVYISHHFNLVIRDLGIKKIHHPPYQAHCKGKVEIANKKIKNSFQKEAEHAGFKTLDELNTAFFAWVAQIYDRQALSTTGEAPGTRFAKGLTRTPRRISDLDEFLQLFLMRETRTVNKYGRVKIKGNSYPVKTARFGSVVMVRFDPFDLSRIFIYDEHNKLVETSEASTLVNSEYPNIPEEKDSPEIEVRKSSREYFERLRSLNAEESKLAHPNLEFGKINKNYNHNKE